MFDYAGFLAKFAGLYSNLKPDRVDSAAFHASSDQQQPASSSAARKGTLAPPRPAKASAGSAAVQPPSSSAPARYASSVARLHPDRSLCFWQINHRISLIALIQSDIHSRHTGLIDYNITFFRKAVQALYDLAQNST